jgi:hypothetical protein
VILQEITEMGFYVGRAKGMKIQNGLVYALLQGQGIFHGIQGFAPLILRRLLSILEMHSHHTGSASQEMLGTLSLSSANSGKKWPKPSRAKLS